MCEAQAVEMSTVGQSKNLQWLDLHKCTVTASNFHRVTRRVRNPASLCKRLFDGPCLDNVPAISHGRKYEKVASEAYFQGKSSSEQLVKVRECGIILHLDKRYLGALPDGLIFNSTATEHGSYGLLEIKCSFTAFQEGLSVHDAVEKKKILCLVPSFLCMRSLPFGQV